MLPYGVDGEIQVAAGVAFLNDSGLVLWEDASSRFMPKPELEFTKKWKLKDPIFGRFMSWNSFSTGAELLLKGVLLSAGVEIRNMKPDILEYPPSDVPEWLLLYGNSKAPRTTVVSYGELGSAIEKLKKLQKDVSIPEPELLFVRAALDLLRSAIRNRDSHAYIPNVRDSHHHLVEKLFCPALNTLCTWLPGGRTSVGEITKNAPNVVQMIS